MAESNVLKLSEGEYYVMGKKASSYEYNVALALERLGFNYEFQVPILGARDKPGGQILDFDIYTVPLYTPMDVQGDYWHRDALLELKLEMAVNEFFAGRQNKLELLWGQDCDTYEHALNALRFMLL